MKRNLFLNTAGLMLAAALALLSGLTGCGGSGGGGAENRPPIPTVGGLAVRGVVSVRASAVPGREAALEAEAPVANATVQFTVEGENVVLSRTKTDAAGNYQLTVRPGIRGRLTVVNGSRQLSAILLAGANATGVVDRNVNLESTVVEVALRNLNTLSYDVKAMEEQVRIGEAPELLAEVKAAYLAGRAPAPAEAAVTAGLTKLVSGEAAATKDCLAGQEWCAVAGKIDAGTAANSYTSRLLLRRDRTDGSNAATSTATVGAGYLIVQLPSGFTLDAISGSAEAGGTVHIEKSGALEGNRVQISFLHGSTAGIGEAIKLADLTLTGARALTVDDRIVVVSQRLLGVLNEKRGGAAKTARDTVLP